MAVVKTKDAEVAVSRLPAAHERFFNELLDEGHGVSLSRWWVGLWYSRILAAGLEGYMQEEGTGAVWCGRGVMGRTTG
jgi:hypothetical protein